MGVQSRTQPYMKFVLYCVVVVLINIVGISLFFRVDLTADNKYSLSQVSREVLTKISEPLTVKIFFTKDLPAPHNITEQYLHDLMDEYAACADENFNYQFYDVTPNEGKELALVTADQKLAEDYGIQAVQVQNIEADEVKVKKAYMGLVIIYGDMVEKVTPIRSTDGLEYQITTAVRKLADKISAFAKLPEKVDVTLVLSSSLYQVAPFMGIKELALLPENVREVIDALNDRLAGKLNFEVIDPDKAHTRQEEISSLDLIRLQWPDIAQKDGSKIASGQGIIGMVLRYQEETVVLPVLNVVNLPFFGTRYSLPKAKELATQVDESMESLIGVNEDIGYMTGHGAPDPNVPNTFDQQPPSEDSLIHFRQLLAQNYSFANTGLPGDRLEKEKVDCLIIARPTEPFSDYELFQIDQFLMRGNNLALFLDRFKQVYPDGQPSPYSQPRNVPVSTGLEKLLAHYGVEIKRSIVMDEACFERPADPRFGQGKQPIYFAPLINNEYINNQPAFMKNIRGLIAMNVAPIELLTDTLEENSITGTTLFSSSKRSWEQRGASFNPMFLRPPGPEAERQSFPLACILEGEFPSYFAGKPVPVKEDKTAEENTDESATTDDSEKDQDHDTGQSVEVTGQVISKSKPAKIFVMGSSQMLYDHMLDTEGRSPNAVFIMNLLDTLNGRDNVAQLRSKRQVYNPIFETSAPVRSLIKWGNIVGLPVLVIIFGCVVWIRRMSRKRYIRMLFSQ